MKKNVAGQKIGAQMVSATDGSAFTGAVTVYVCVDAGSQGAGSVGAGACTHEGNGYHTYAPSDAETNGDLVAFTFTGSGAVPATVQVFTSYPQTGDSYALLGSPAGASVSADIADIEGKVDDLETRLTAARAGYLDNINNAALQTTVAQTGDAYARLGSPAGASVSADIAAVKGDTAAVLDDTGTSGVKLNPAQAGVAFTGQVKITADALGEGALHIVNTSAIAGDGVYAEGKNDGMQVKATAALGVGLRTDGGYGMYNLGTVAGLYNDAPTPQHGSITGNLSGSVGSVTSGVSLADDAITAAKFDETTAYPLKSADTGATAVARTGADSDTLETLSDQLDAIDVSGTAAAVWTYTTRTLTQSSTSTTDSTTAGSISRRRGDRWSISLTLGAITGYTSLWFTVKAATSDADSAAIFQIKKNASGTGDGLLYVNGAVATDATKGSVTVSNATTGAVIVALDESITDDIVPATYSYDCQVLISGSVSTPDSGTFAVTADVTRVIA